MDQTWSDREHHRTRFDLTSRGGQPGGDEAGAVLQRVVKAGRLEGSRQIQPRS